MLDIERQQQNYNRMKAAFGSSVNIHISNSINIDRFKTDKHPAAVHAREWGKRKPYYLERMEQEKKKKEKQVEG